MTNKRFGPDDVELAEVEVEQQPESIPGYSLNSSLKTKWSSIPKRYKLASIIIVGVVILAVAVIAILLPFAFNATRSKTREYYLQAESLSWNYAPLGYNAITGNPWTTYEASYATSSETHINNYLKGVFRAYTDNSFTSAIERPAEEDYMGFYGPVLRGAVGETINITVKNTLAFPISFQITGLQISNDMDGRSYGPNVANPSTSIAPGQTFTYVFTISEKNGPESGKFSSRVYSYSSGVHEPSGFHTGLAGVMIISSKGEIPSDVDQEIVLFTSMVDESQSELLCTNIAPVFQAFPLNCSLPTINQQIINTLAPTILEANRKYSINGFLYGNMPTVHVPLGATTRWYVVNLGPDTHSILWSGQVLQLADAYTGIAVAVTGSAQIVDIVADFPGTWLIEAYGSAQAKGMSALFVIGESQ